LRWTWDSERYRPVKAELRAVLADRRWHSHRELVEKMLAAGDLAPRTCSNLLRELVKDWKIETRGAYQPGGPGGRDTREYRLVDQQSVEAASVAEALAAIERDIKRARHRLDHQNKILAEASAMVVALTEAIKEMEEMREIMKGQQ
jgi:DNA-binding PadR family transcriptional regulator